MRPVLLLAALLACGCGPVAEPTTLPPRTEPAAPRFPDSRVMVTGSVVNLRQGPGTGYMVVDRVQRGDTLIVLGEFGEWYRVHFPERSVFAWVHAGLTSGADLPR